MAGSFVRAPITMFRRSRPDAEPLPWEWAVERLTACEDYWLVTEVLRAMVAIYNPKYGWDFPEDGPDIGGVIAVAPTKVLAWVTAPNDVAKDSPFPVAASRWVRTTT